MTTPPRPSFPQNPEEFDADPRVSFSKLVDKFILETDDGQEYEFDDALKRWVPVLDDALLEKQREAYAVQGVDESEPAQQSKKKRKQEHTNGEQEVGGRLVSSKKAKPAAEPRERKNTAIYITNIPLDVDVDEIQSVFSRCGVIAEEIDNRRPRIKLYADDQGNLKGDAMIVYFKPESVQLAIQMLDETNFRLGEAAPGGKMKVVEADFSYKAQKDPPPKSSGKDKKKIIKKTQKLNSKLADWDDDDPSTIRDTSSRWDKFVILKHMFTLAELEEDPDAISDIKDDIQEECEKIGPVSAVVIYDKEPDGVASVRFSNAEDATACVQLMNGRFFANAQVSANIATGAEKFQRSNPKETVVVNDAILGLNGAKEELVGEGEEEA